MGDFVRARVLRALGLGTLWVQLDALSTRMKRLEGDLAAQAELGRQTAVRAIPRDLKRPKAAGARSCR